MDAAINLEADVLVVGGGARIMAQMTCASAIGGRKASMNVHAGSEDNRR